MFDRLQKKWKVGGLQLFLILCTFAIGGSLTGFIGKKIMNMLAIQQDWIWAIIYIILITILWPLSVLMVSIVFGQFRFFIGYIRKMGIKLGLVGQPKETPAQNTIRIALFASGSGSNAQKIIEHFKKKTAADQPSVEIVLLVCNKPGAGVLQIAAKEKISTLLIEKGAFFSGDAYLPVLRELGIEYIVLAGFLWKVPDALVEAYHGKMVNIHPALLPKFGGKGMYGHYVHEAVLAAGEKESGISIHLVDGHYDHGRVIFQARCPVLETDSAETLAKRVQLLEHEHYPVVLEKFFAGHMVL